MFWCVLRFKPSETSHEHSCLQIKTAEIAYGTPATFPRYATTQLRNFADVLRLMEKHGGWNVKDGKRVMATEYVQHNLGP